MYFVVHNPVAGRGRSVRALRAVEAYLAEHAMPYRLLTSLRRGHARELTASLPADASVLAVGGDGTVHEVAGCCVGSRRTLGVVPAGSGDDFAFALGIDRHDIPRALDRVRAGTLRSVDVGIANGRPFVNAVGIGFDADVAAHVATAPGVFHGVAAYLYALLAAMKDLSLADVRVEVDDVVVHDGAALLVATQNGPRSGGSFLIAPDARTDDGVLDVVVAGRFTRAGVLGILPKLMTGAHLGHPEVRAFRGRRVRMTWSRNRPYHLEGEVVAPVRELEIELRPRALHVWT